jgi:hypothetical protein
MNIKIKRLLLFIIIIYFGIGVLFASDKKKADEALSYVETEKYEKAFDISKTIKSFSWKAWVLTKIGKKYIDTGKKDEGLKILSQALDVAKKIKNINMRDKVLVNISYTYSGIGEPISLSELGVVSVWKQFRWDKKKCEKHKGVDVVGKKRYLVLKNNLSKMALAFKPTTQTCISDFTLYNDKLYIAATTNTWIKRHGDILVFDFKTQKCKKDFTVNEQGMYLMHTANNKIYVAGPDADDGGWELGNMYLYDGVKWKEKRTIPNGLHIHDIARYKGKLYVSAGVKGTESHVYVSSDEGETWETSFKHYNIAFGTGSLTTMAVFKNMLIVNQGNFGLAYAGVEKEKDYDFFIFDGRSWEGKKAPDAKMDMVHPCYGEYKNKLYVGGFTSSYSFNGRSFRLIRDFNDLKVRAFAVCNNYFFAAADNLYELFKQKGKKSIKIKVGSKKSTYEVLHPVYKESLSKIYYLSGYKWKPIFTMPEGTVVTALNQYKGRLYAGTAPRGEIYVSLVASNGIFQSEPIKVPCFKNIKLFWKSFISKGTNVKFQIRYALDKNILKDTAFVGPNGKEDTFFNKSGTKLPFNKKSLGWIQYRVVLSTKDKRHTPYLFEVRLGYK